MVKLTRKINSLFWQLLIILCLLLAYSNAFSFFKKPHWLQKLSKEEVTFWDQMSQDFAIECDQSNPYVQKQIRWYQQHPKHLQKILKRAEPFIHYVYEQTRRNNLPAELALIPLLESQYNPTVGAPSGAAGLWQMMPGTAAKFGLKMNHTYDGRRDVTASTKAALSYLSYLYYYFNKNWLLALAAYDAGEGKVQSIARRHQNFWQLPLSRETREYVPRLIALAHIIKQPREYNMALPSVSNQASLTELTWNEAKVINISETARNLGVDDQTFRRLNPGIRKNVATVPRTLTLLVPGENSRSITTDPINNTFKRDEIPLNNSTKNETTADHNGAEKLPIPEAVMPTLINYKIKSRDTLNLIAKKFHTTTKQIKSDNHLTSNRLRTGKTLVISTKKVQAEKINIPITKTNQNYTIKQGDTLSSIAKEFQIPVKRLKTANHLKNEKQLKIGRKLLIPV